MNLRLLFAGCWLLLLAASAAWAEGAYQWASFVGNAGGYGDADGPGSVARFHNPEAVATDALGNVYVADRDNHTIRKIAADGTVSTLAGSPGVQGTADGPGSTARFYNPAGVAVDGAGNVYVSDLGNRRIRKVTAQGVVTTLGAIEYPAGIGLDAAGNIYVADLYGQVICKMTGQGVVTTLAGSRFQIGRTDGAGAAARFSNPYGLAVQPDGTVFVADSGNHSIRKITPGGDVTTVAGNGSPGIADGTAGAARFNSPQGVAVDASGNLFVGDSVNDTIRQVTGAGVVTTLAGIARAGGNADGIGSTARFGYPSGLAVDANGNVFVADRDNQSIRKVTLAHQVTTLAGSPADEVDLTEFYGVFSPFGVALDSIGNAYVADPANHIIRKVTAAGVMTIFAGSPGFPGSADGTGAAARFKAPSGVAVDADGNVFVADRDNCTVRKVTSAGVVSTFVGSVGQYGSVNATGAAARFYNPSALAVDGSGNLYVLDYSVIRKVTSAGVVTSLAGAPYPGGSVDGQGAAARFNYPRALAVDTLGNVFVADTENGTIRKVTPAGFVSTFAGIAGFYGSTDGVGNTARFYEPSGVAVDRTGNVFVADAHIIRKITNSGVVTTIGGMTGLSGNQGGLGAAARFTQPAGVAVSAAGRLYVADPANRNVMLGTPLRDAILQQPAGSSLVSGTSAVDFGGVGAHGKGDFGPLPPGSARTFTVINNGADPLPGLSVSVRGDVQDFIATQLPGFNKVGPTLQPGARSTFTVTFNPTAVGPRTAVVRLTSSDPSETPFDVALTGTGLDITPPKLTAVSIASGNPDPRWARAEATTGELITLSFTANEPLQSATVSIAGQPAAVIGKETTWIATLKAGLNLPQQEPLSFSILAKDLAGNTVTVTATTDQSFVRIDAIAPAIVPPADVIVEATDLSGMTVNYPPLSVSDASGPPTVVYSKASGSFFALGTEKVTVTATDPAGNATTKSFLVRVQDTTPPVITGTFAPTLLQNEPLPDYIRQATIQDLSATPGYRQDPPPGSYLTVGLHTITLASTDTSGNTGTVSFTVDVRPVQAVSEALLRSGEQAPGAGTSAGLPGDAKVASFGDPAIDNENAIVFSAVWTSATLGRGTGVFTPTKCLARTGVGSPFGTLGDPAIDAGNVAFLATYYHAPAALASLVLYRPAGGETGVVAQGGDEAPGTGGATFKSFTQVAVSGRSLAVLAQLTPNTGLPKTAAGSDFGVWAQDATHPLTLMLREGQEIGTKKIKTLVVFHGGNGSPGQGRGWLLEVNAVAQLQALVRFTDNTEALLAADINGNIAILSSAPFGAGLPTLAGATFASYSFPALNAYGDHAFLGTLAVGPGGVKATDNRGIFLRNRDGTYDAVARGGVPAAGAAGGTGARGAVFSTFYDPVLEDYGGLAFRSLLADVNPASNDSLWWQPAGAPLRLLAQEGRPTADSNIAGEKWMAFTSLAIAPNRGPIFTATVTGGVTGLWATDYRNRLRQIFRTGDTIDGKQVAGFSVLKALPGTTGMTRSFNGAGHIVWRAVFKDGSTGLVQTLVP
ncbi:MAG TPA: choice-of-anchor tandem repeat NxxGxxAF-containing protein [Chthoniobacteraceae bacterium]|jgi:sugar lactone lactonase YvrE|nr:choice-of-anchor tandem repeat NxxGxxAF-containing protein [Chthoniobacteraceae bacterium]